MVGNPSGSQVNWLQASKVVNLMKFIKEKVIVHCGVLSNFLII